MRWIMGARTREGLQGMCLEPLSTLRMNPALLRTSAWRALYHSTGKMVQAPLSTQPVVFPVVSSAMV